MRRRFLLSWLAVLFGTTPAWAQPLASPPPPEPRFSLDFSAVDAPFLAENGLLTFPSMEQSLELSNDFYKLGHWGLLSAWGDETIARRVLGGISVAAFDVFSIWLPGGMGWLHEEWHRAVMSRRDVESFNDIYKFDIGSELIAVSHVLDEDLVRFKAEHPAEFVRLPAAGMEAEAEQNFALERENFFRDSRLFIQPLLAINYVSIALYMRTCASTEADASTDESNIADGADVAKRDFTGLDCDGWVYDLHRPREPYADRGVHPSGVGIDRYRRFSDLTATERSFLRLQAGLSLLNFVDPQLFGLRRFSVSDPFGGGELHFNASLRHHLTSFGYTVDLNVLLQRSPYDLVFIIHNYLNDQLYLPGVELELSRFPLALGGAILHVSPRLLLWLQPRAQEFFTSAVRPGALAGLKTSYALTPWF